MNAIVEFPALAAFDRMTQFELDYDPELRTLFSWMKPSPRPCFNRELLEEVVKVEGTLEEHGGWIAYRGQPHRVDYAVFGSRVEGVFNLGGDLSLFIQSIMRKDQRELERYGNLCVDNMYRRISSFNAEIATISLVQGKAFGGGFECALASDTLVAERSATFSLPEVLFNMFPGMGALSLLARRIGLRKAEEIIMSGEVFTAEHMHKLGVVDVLVDDGMGVDAVRGIIRTRQRRQNSYSAMLRAKREYLPIPHAEMRSIVSVWVDAVLRLETRDLRMMARLVKAQDRLLARTVDEEKVDELFAPLAVAAASA
jgi:DSF synthase